MANGTRTHSLFSEGFTFFQEFLKHPLQIGSIIPSSPFLEQRLLCSANLDSAHTVVELGSGTGGTTHAILRAMPTDARLLSIEINPQFHRLIGSINDARLIPHLGDAGDLPAILSRYGLSAPDVVISGIPFSTMHHRTAERILRAITSSLSNQGRFVAYQVSSRIGELCAPMLGPPRMELELRNIPPMRIFCWQKRVNQTATTLNVSDARL